MNDSIPNIWQMQTDRDSAALIQSLQHTDDEIRRRAAVSLRVIGDTQAVEPLRELLEQERNPQVRVAVIAALDHLAPKTTDTGSLVERGNQPQSRVERLIDYLTGPRPEAAIQAAKALGELGDKVAVPPLVIVFRNKRQPPSVRLAAAEALLVMDSAPAEVTLLAALRNEKWHLRRNGAAILGQLHADWAVVPLGEAAATDDNPRVAKTAMAALQRIGTAEAHEQIAMVKRHRAAKKAKPAPPGRGQQDVEPTIASRPPGFGRLGQAPPSTRNTTPYPPKTPPPDEDTSQLNPAPQPPPAKPSTQERQQSRRRKSATERLNSPDDSSAQ